MRHLTNGRASLKSTWTPSSSCPPPFWGLLAKGTEEDKGFWASITGTMGQAQEHFCYNASKAAAKNMTNLKVLSTELALNGIPIRVNGISPGIFESEMTGVTISPGPAVSDICKVCIMSLQSALEGMYGWKASSWIFVTKAFMRRAEEMVATALYLASSGGYTNGQEINIDGEFLATNP
ncbi:hypothetical protein DFP72DRAFT_1065827 [Ephemerocybe angulata]|uniref:NAD(P)-binding protein n=1 Tax=Ephemerocybe angulata TaxID=980116 RepID=A0A8H6MAY8_9AGAR|nr:hypothetical protein DFP72DRAFT_1065827 [Tulosesus angulatus]